MSKFKIGDKIYSKKRGQWGIVDYIYKTGFTANMEDGNNTVFIDFEVEEYIEPKYKIGDIIYKYPSSRKNPTMRDTCEIVKFALNKKKGAYSYLAFDPDGYIACFQESEVVLVEKKVKVVEEMTLAEVCRKLGKNIKIVK